MDARARGAVAWTARKWAVSAFVVIHLGATLVWVLPASPLRAALFRPAAYYILPLGLWQFWGMFAPDPIRDTLTLEAEAVDARGLRYAFAFPKVADYGPWLGVARFRHSKFAANLQIEEAAAIREMAARHVVRQLALPAEAFPVDVSLRFQVRPTPTPGGPPADPMTPTFPRVLGNYRFPSLAEVRP